VADLDGASGQGEQPVGGERFQHRLYIAQDVAYARDTVRYLCAVAGRSLTRAEWTSDVGTEVGYQNVCP